MNHRISIDLGQRSYDIAVGSGVLSELGTTARALGLGERVLIISDSNVEPIYGQAARGSLGFAGFTPKTAVIPAGEAGKNLAAVARLYDAAVEAGLDRNSSIVALGGGVVGDIAGFVAATYLRGISYLQVPTTLLAQVDSSVGGKTGVDHPKGKNYIGAFHQPAGVWIDLATLKTLPPREIAAGMAEVIKYGMIWDEALLAEIESALPHLLALDEAALAPVVVACCKIKAEVVSRDERESGLRAILNFGHTAGHALESITGYATYLHGEAISIGMMVACRLAERLAMLDVGVTERLSLVLQRTGLPVAMPTVDVDALVGLMRKDKKARGGSLNFVLPTRPGQVEMVKNIDEIALRAALIHIS